MAEVVGTISAVIGIAAAAAQSAQSILAIINEISNASEKLQRLREELEVLEGVLTAVGKATNADPPAEDDPVLLALRKCWDELEKLEKLLKRLQAPEGAGRLKRFTKDFSAFLEDPKLEDAIRTLQRHENRVCFALTATIYGYVSRSVHDSSL